MRIILSLILLFLFISCKKIEQKKELVSKIETNKTKDSIILLNKYKSGQTKYIVYAKDSGKCEELHINYYKNRQLKAKGCQGHFGSWGVPVGTWNYYDSLGKLTRREIYNHHKIKGWLKIIKYTKKNNIEEKIVGYNPHFGELDTVWKWSLKKKDGEIVNLLNRK